MAVLAMSPVSRSRHFQQAPSSVSVAHSVSAFGAHKPIGAAFGFHKPIGASMKPSVSLSVASSSGCSHHLASVPSIAPSLGALPARAPFSATTKVSATPGIGYLLFAFANSIDGPDGEGREIRLGLPSKGGMADDTLRFLKAAASGWSFDAITSMSKVVLQLSSLVAFLKPNLENFMSIVKDAVFRGQRPPRVYDVFISYKKDDTLQFVIRLKTALDGRGIRTFIDSTLEAGVWVQPAIEEAIERSEIAVVIVSENYHESPWCLIELEKILECKKKRGLIVLPIFQGMDPKVLREQPRHFVENIGRGEKGFKQLQPHEIEKHRDNLRTLGMINALPIRRSSFLREVVEAVDAVDAADQISAKVSRSA